MNNLKLWGLSPLASLGRRIFFPFLSFPFLSFHSQGILHNSPFSFLLLLLRYFLLFFTLWWWCIGESFCRMAGGGGGRGTSILKKAARKIVVAAYACRSFSPRKTRSVSFFLPFLSLTLLQLFDFMPEFIVFPLFFCSQFLFRPVVFCFSWNLDSDVWWLLILIFLFLDFVRQVSNLSSLSAEKPRHAVEEVGEAEIAEQTESVATNSLPSKVIDHPFEQFT